MEWTASDRGSQVQIEGPIGAKKPSNQRMKQIFETLWLPMATLAHVFA